MDYVKMIQNMGRICSVLELSKRVQIAGDTEESLLHADHATQSVESIKDFLDAPIGDKKELAMKKLFAAASMISREKGLFPNFPTDSAQIAATIDEGLTRVKMNHLVGVGVISAEKAINHVIDHAVARAAVILDMAIDSGMVGKVAANGITALAHMIPRLGPIIGPIAENYKPIIAETANRVAQAAKEPIKYGMQLMAQKAKELVRTTLEKAKDYAVNRVPQLAKKALSIIRI